MPDKIVMDELDSAIERLRAVTPDVLFLAHGVGHVKAWKCGDMFYLECQRAGGDLLGVV